MAKKANPTVVGGFVVGAVVLAVGGIITFGKGDLFAEEFKYVAHFESSVSGLDVGAPIRFSGVQVGTVSDVRAVWNEDFTKARIPVELTFDTGSVQAPSTGTGPTPIEADPIAVMSRMIDRGLRAELLQDSFVTGKQYVGLEFYPETEARLLGGTDLPEMPTVEAGLARIRKNIEELPFEEVLESTIAALDAIEALVANPEIEKLVANFNRLVEDVDAEISPLSESVRGTLEDARALMQSVDAEVRPLSESTQVTLGDARAFLESTDEQLASVSEGLSKLLSDVDAEVQPLSSSAIATLDEAREGIAYLNKALGEDNTMVYRTAGLLEELTEAARAVRILADFIERHPEAFLSGKKGP
jgi:paraquat-inducible protein B